MPRFGFVGGTYQHPQSNVNAESCINWVPEVLPAQAAGKSRIVYRSRPGLAALGAGTGAGRWRACAELNGRAFVVSGGGLYEVDSAGTTTLRSTTVDALGDDGTPASMAFNGPQGDQLCVISNGNGFILTLSTNAFAQITDPQFPANAKQVVFWRGHFVVIPDDSTTFSLSALYDGTSWATADVGEKSLSSDYIHALLVDEDQGELWLIGTHKTEVWWYNGALGFPAQPVDVLIPSGSAASFGWCLVGGAVYGLAHSREGGLVVVRFQSGYSPERISHHAMEAAIQGYDETVIAKAYAFALEWQGHRFFVLTFDDVATWVYDEASDLWHQWDYKNDLGVSEAFLGLGHLHIDGLHIMGSRVDGAIYHFSADYYDDDGVEIRRVRRAPYIHAEGKRVRHDAITFDFQLGVGNADVVDGDGELRQPVAMVRWSDDQARTWSTEQQIELGMQGEYAGRAQLRRLGLAGFSGRVYELVVTDPIVAALTDAYVDVGMAA